MTDQPDSKPPKAFVLDTSVLIHDPQAVHQFEENHVFIPGEVLEELDRLKTEQSSRGRHAREVHRVLNEIFPNEQAMSTGFRKAEGGEIRLIFNAYLQKDIRGCERWARMRELFPDMGKMDNRILACGVFVAEEHYPCRTIIVSKDINLQLKARMLGMDSQDYLTGRVKDDEIFASEHKKIFVTAQQMQRFASSGTLEVPAESLEKISAGSYLLMEDERGKTMPAKHFSNGTLNRIDDHRTVAVRGASHIKARNLGQQFFLDALFDEAVNLITVYGKAGTGKTFLAIAAGLQQIYDGLFNKLIVTRAVVPMGRDIGFLPGSKEEKMMAWLQPIYDNIEAILSPAPTILPNGRKKKKEEPKEANGGHQRIIKPHERLQSAGVLEVEALSHIRGRSIPRAFFIVDEAQQLSPHEAKTIVTRMGDGSKLIMIGDLAQIDNPYVDAHSNGLVYTRNSFKGQGISAHVNLIKGERSFLSELGANLM